MTIIADPYYNTIIGKWKGYGFYVREVEDNIKPDDALVVIHHNGTIVASTYRSSLGDGSILRRWCERYFKEHLMGRFTNEACC